MLPAALASGATALSPRALKDPMSVREMPPTRGAERYKKVLGFVWVGSIVGITLAVSAILSIAFDIPFEDPARAWRGLARNYAMLSACGISAWISHRGTRHNLAPSEWLIAVVVLLAWAAILLR